MGGKETEKKCFYICKIYSRSSYTHYFFTMTAVGAGVDDVSAVVTGVDEEPVNL